MANLENHIYETSGYRIKKENGRYMVYERKFLRWTYIYPWGSVKDAKTFIESRIKKKKELEKKREEEHWLTEDEVMKELI